MKKREGRVGEGGEGGVRRERRREEEGSGSRRAHGKKTERNSS